ncbi:MAG: site-2 protease family protein, partial [Verrucomicrobiota bacterium]|nr:site-2 protease family protein [Verrucomicrobiota bacterium]
EAVVFICLVFLCVLLHEFGHALAARRYGIRTPDITLLPIGGLARLERMPDKPSEELVIAIAGPAVNVVIAALLWLWAGLTGSFPHLMMVEEAGSSLPAKLLVVNMWLVVFNLIPAFPMDGGRVLRAFLAMRMDYARATQIAATIGQGCAFVFGFWGLGLFGTPQNVLLVLIAIFVFFGAAQEAAFAQFKSISSGLRVRSAMITEFQTLPLRATLNEAIEALLRSSQHDFPVLNEAGELRGLLTRDGLINALRRTDGDTPVTEVMRVDVPSVHYTMLFDRALTILQESGCPALPVLDSTGRLVGLFTRENVGELMMVREALANASAANSRPSKPPPLPVS